MDGLLKFGCVKMTGERGDRFCGLVGVIGLDGVVEGRGGAGGMYDSLNRSYSSFRL